MPPVDYTVEPHPFLGVPISPDLQALIDVYVATYAEWRELEPAAVAAFKAHQDSKAAIVAWFEDRGLALPSHDDQPGELEPEPIDPPDAPLWKDTFPDLPFDAPAVPAYDVPSELSCDWIIEKGVATSTRGLDPIPFDSKGHVCGHAYRASVAAGHELPIRFGVVDDAGGAYACGLYNSASGDSLCVEDSRYTNGWAPIEVEFVGLRPDAEVNLGWSNRWGYAARVAAFNIGLRGRNDSFVIRANDGVDTCILDGCWFLPAKGYAQTGGMHASGLHIDKWRTLILRGLQWRGKKPSDPGISLREHSFYLKSCIGEGDGRGTWIVGNDLRGGNRTGFQVRPQADTNPTPSSPIVVAYNVADEFGWNHGSTGETYDGGSVLTVWASPEAPVFIFGNVVTNAKYGCCVLSPQKPERNYLNDAGHVVESVHVFGNRFHNPQGDRACMSITGSELVRIYEGNLLDGGVRPDLVLDDSWGLSVSDGIANGKVEVVGQPALDALLLLDVRTHDSSKPGKLKPLSSSDLESFFVAAESIAAPAP